jgi:hypothetical protein
VGPARPHGRRLILTRGLPFDFNSRMSYFQRRSDVGQHLPTSLINPKIQMGGRNQQWRRG